jgi:DNA repair protein RadC
VTIPSLWEQAPLSNAEPGTTALSGERTRRSISAVSPNAPAEQVDVGSIVPNSENPTRELRERLKRYGSETLSTQELLSLILLRGQGNERRVERVSALLAQYRLPELLNVDVSQLSQQLGEAKAVQIKAVLEVARRLLLPSPDEKYTIKSPVDAANLVMMEMAYLDHEEMRVLALDTKNGVVGNHKVYQGTVNSSVLRAAEIFRPAVTRNCPGVIVCHNHPSGDPTPSPEDEKVTSQLVEAGNLLDIELVDHLIIGNHRFVSLKERMRW